MVTAADFDRLVQDPEVLGKVMDAIARQLRRRHGDRWLAAWADPTGQDELDILRGAEAAFRSLEAEGKAPGWEQIREQAGKWVSRIIALKRQQWAEWGRLAEQVATAQVTSHGDVPWSGLGGWILDGAARVRLVGELEDRLRPMLTLERQVAAEADIRALAEAVVQENLGAGMLEEFLADQSLTEIMVGRGGRIWVEKDGRLLDTGKTVPERRALWFAQRLAAVIGSRVDQSEPTMDGFLPDGSRVHVILPPVAMDGIAITIRRHSRRPSLEQMIANGALSQESAAFLQVAVEGRANILVSGGTSSGKTSMLNILAGFIPPGERVITMEDAPELQLPLPHWIRLRTRRANIEGRGEITMRQLVRESLRMRPDRIVVGEVRGAEALDMIEAENTGHDGGLSTAHANGPRDMLKRLGLMCRRGDPTLTEYGAYELIESAIHLIVHTERRVIGGVVVRGVQEIVEVEAFRPDAGRQGAEGFILRPIFARGTDRVLRRVGNISERLAQHLTLNGVDAGRWAK